MKIYTVYAKRWDKGWELHIDGVGVTQSRALANAEGVARSYIAMTADVPADSFGVVVFAGDPGPEPLTDAEVAGLVAWVASEGGDEGMLAAVRAALAVQRAEHGCEQLAASRDDEAAVINPALRRGAEQVRKLVEDRRLHVRVSSPSPNAERLRQAMGWEKLPEMTPEQRAQFDEDNEKAREDARRFYGQLAASRDAEDDAHESVVRARSRDAEDDAYELVELPVEGDASRLYGGFVAAPDAPACDCGHEFSVDPRWWHLDECAFRRHHLVGGDLETRALLADPDARRRLEEGRAEIARGDYVTADEMDRLMDPAASVGEVEIVRLTPDEQRCAIDAELVKLGMTREEIREQARTGEFVSVRARQLWMATGGTI